MAFCLLGTGLLTGLPAAAQPQTPADCKVGCTSNDVQIIRAFLVDPSTNLELTSSFACNGTATVKLGLELTTKTPRVGVEVYANIKNFSNGVVGSLLTNTKQCFSVALNQPTNRVVFQSTFSWTCGASIVLTDVFLAWGTGNTDYCQGSAAFRCPGTPSKCYQLPPGQYIPIQVPTSTSASATACADPGGTTGTFDLRTLVDDVSGGQTNVVVTWYSDSTLSTLITDSTSYSTDDTTIYAKVANSSNSSIYSRAKVTLTVTESPATPTICAVQPSLCGPATGSIKVLSPTGGRYEYSINGGTSWRSSPQFDSLAAGSSPYILIRANGCVSDTAFCSDATTCSSNARLNNAVSTQKAPSKNMRTIRPKETGGNELKVQAYPNPFRNTVSFNFRTPVSGRVLLEVYDVAGRRVAATNYGYAEAGTVRTVTLSLKGNVNALVLYCLTVGSKTVNGRLLQQD
ncbi:hypothetical protein GCM10028786_33440 [Flaviaesturariibacter terrae]